MAPARGKKTSLTDAVKLQLEKEAYIWNRKIAGRIVIFGIAIFLAIPILEQITSLAYKPLKLGGYAFGPGLVIAAIGIMWRVIDKLPAMAEVIARVKKGVGK